MKCYGFKDIDIKINRKSYKFRAIKSEVDSPVLGWDFMKKHKLGLDWNEFGDNCIVDKVAKISIALPYKPLSSTTSKKHKSLSVIQVQPKVVRSDPAELLHQISAIQSLSDEPEKSVPISPEYQALLDKYPDLLNLASFKEEFTKNGVIHRIHIKKDAKPVKAKLRRLIPGSEKAIKAKEAFDELIRLGIVERVDPAEPNNWVSPLHFVLKPDNTLRTVGDYRGLNQATELDNFPLPNVREHVNHLAGSSIFSKIDLKKAFHQILIDKRDRKFTCVTTPWGLFNFRRLSMGMANSAQSFQRLVEAVVGEDLKERGIFIYLDDLLVFNKTKEDHLKLLDDLFEKLAKAGLTLALDKCQFGATSINYLGYNISREGLAPIEKKLQALQQFPPPNKQKDLLGFLGALNYYRASCLTS